MIERRELISHLDYFFRPPAWFYEQIETVIELAAAGHYDTPADLDGGRYPVRELVEDYQLEELVELVRNPPPEPEPPELLARF